MNIVKIEASANGSHDNFDGISFVPDGCALIPENIEIPSSFPFVDIEVEEIDGIMTVTSMTRREVPIDLKRIRNEKEAEISKACNVAIVTGMDVETSVGVEHFSLQETDQINLSTALSAIQSGATAYPYHADGSLCRLYTAEEIMAITQAATNHKLYHTTLCNHVLTWVRRAETAEEIESITYSEENLPEDLAANMASIFAAATAI